MIVCFIPFPPRSNEENVKLLKQDKTQNQAFLLKEFQIGELLRGTDLGGKHCSSRGVWGTGGHGGEGSTLQHRR